MPGHLQMALEEFMVRHVAMTGEKNHQKAAVIRFYSFTKDTIVLGYGQDVDIIKKPHISITRRITGGSHVQTGTNTIAYSFIVPRDGTFSHYEELRAYYANLVAKALKKLGIGAIDIDNSASTIMVDGRIIASHAIWWGIKSALLHGLIILHPYDVDSIAKRIILQKRMIGQSIYSEFAALKKLPTVSLELEHKMVASLLQAPLIYTVVADAILQQVTGGRYRKRRITPDVRKSVSEYVRDKYAAHPWIEKRLPPYRFQEVEEIPGEELAGPLKLNQGYCLFSQVKDDDFKRMSEAE